MELRDEFAKAASNPTWLNARVKISRIGTNGQIEETHYGPTNRELLWAHKTGKCDAMCSFCYAEASDLMMKEREKPLTKQ